MAANPHPTQQVTAPVDAVLGAVAGTAELQRELQARPDALDSAHLLARKLGRAIGHDPGRQQPNAAGLAVHYGLGAASGARVRAREQAVPGQWRAGLPFGVALFVVNDEISAPLFGLARGPRAYPPQAHLRGLIADPVLDVATDRLLTAGRRVSTEAARTGPPYRVAAQKTTAHHIAADLRLP